MTILNVAVTADRALISTDTAIDTTGGRCASKCLSLPALGVAIAFRGDLFFVGSVIGQALAASYGFDAFVPLFIQSAAECFKNAVAYSAAAGMPIGDAQQVMIAGWSDQAGAMAARVFTQTDRAAGFVEQPLEHYAAAPREGVTPSEQETLENALASHAGHLEIARSQVAWARRSHPQVPFGGDLIITELHRDNARQWRYRI